MLYFELALSYWKFHKRRAFSIVLAVMLGTAAIFTALLLVRSLKVGEMEESLDDRGNYDMAFYISSDAAEKEIMEDTDFGEFGTIYRLGTAFVKDGGDGEAFPIGSIKDSGSERMWHLTPLEGRYPECSGEITIDKQTMRELGYPAKLGEKVFLTLKDYNEKEVIKKEFTVVGIIEQIYIDEEDDGYGGIGWERRCCSPYFNDSNAGKISGPYAYFSSQDCSKFSDLSNKIILANVSEDGNYDDVGIAVKYYDALFDKDWVRDDIRFDFYNNCYNRSIVANNTVLSWKDDGNGNIDLNTNGTDAVTKRMEEGRGYVDSTTRIVIPVIAGIIILLTVVSTYEAVKTAMEERTRMMGLLRCVGLTKRQSFFLLVTEVCSFSFFAIVGGYFLGFGMYEGLRVILEKCFGTKIYSSFFIDSYFLPFIRAVTFEPMTVPVLLMGVCVLITAIIAAIQMTKFSPLQAYKQQKREKRGKKLFQKEKSQISYFSPVRIFAKYVRENSFTGKILLYFNVFLLMASAVFGYVYFRASVDVSNRFVKEELENTGLKDCDYYADKTLSSLTDTFGDLFHNMGITQEVYDTLSKAEGVKNTFGIIADRNTRLKAETVEEDKRLSEFLEVLKNDEGDYKIPTVAVRNESLKELSKYVAAGKLDEKKLNSGEEIAVILLEKKQADLFSIGQSVSIFQKIYAKEIDEDEDYLIEGGDIYSILAKRKMQTKIGAVIVLEKSVIGKYYCGDYRDITMEGSGGKINFLTGIEGLKKWNVPDKNYTRIQISLNDEISGEERDNFEKVWYQALSKTKYMYSSSRFEKESMMAEKSRMTMGIFWLLILLLFLIGILGMMNVFAIRLRNMRQDIALLRLVGAEENFLDRVVLRRFMMIPVICGILSAFPVVIAQKIYDYGMQVREQVLSSTHDFSYFDYSPWYFQLPYPVDFYQYHLPIVVLVTIFVLCIIFLIGLLPEIRRMQKENLIDVVRKSE